MSLTPDDPRLTAYALGELDDGDRAAVEQELAESESAREALEQIRAAVAELTEALQLEPVELLREEQRVAIAGEAVLVAPVEVPDLAPAARRARFIALAGAVMSIVAASILMLVLPSPSRHAARPVAQSEHSILMSPSSDDAVTYEFAESDLFGRDMNLDPDVSGEFNIVAGGALSKPVSRWGRTGVSEGAVGSVTASVPGPQSSTERHGASDDHRDSAPYASRIVVDETIANPELSRPEDRMILGVGLGEAEVVQEEADGRQRILAREMQSQTRLSTMAAGEAAARLARAKEFRKKFSDVERDFSLPPTGLIHDPSNEAYEPIIENEFLSPLTQPLSTFSIDVDTASYSNVRRFLKHGQLPPPSAVRIEELVNYFRYDYPQPDYGRPFAVHLEAGPCPWNSEHRLVRIGLKGREIERDQRPVSNLVFLLDVSGSMQDANKLPLVKQAMALLVNEMNENDRIAIVTYAGNAGLVLDSTSGQYKESILSAIASLNAGGSTNGEEGIRLAYTQAVKNFTENGTNRVILCTDGDFNVGISSDDELVRMIEQQAKSGVFLSIFGFGMGNLNDAKLEKLADKGNGHYGYIDDIREAKKVFIEDLTGTLYTIAKDVKIQVEFNPARVGSYRLLGYENRVLAARDFNDDTKDAGEIGAGHTVTALYEVVPPGAVKANGNGDPLKYQGTGKKEAGGGRQEAGEEKSEKAEKAEASEELLTVKLRYKQPNEEQSVKIEYPLVDKKQTAMPSEDFEWAASVAAFGMVLRDSKHRGQADLELVRELALGSRGNDESGYRREFIDLVYTARAIVARQKGQPVPQPEPLPAPDAEKRAAVEGKYRQLLKKLEVAGDVRTYGPFHDFGYWAGTSYAGQNELPAGYWVYVAPHWYIWGETK